MVSIEQAASNALCAYLRDRLAGDVVVEPRWPDPEKPLPPKAVTVLRAGTAEHKMVMTSNPVSAVELDPPDPTRKLYRWIVLEVTQPLQIDCWTVYDVTRDDLCAALTAALHAGDQTNADPIGPGLVLRLPAEDGWDGVAEYLFEQVSFSDNVSSIGQSEFRATISGEARMAIYVEAESSRTARIKLQQRLNRNEAQ